MSTLEDLFFDVSGEKGEAGIIRDISFTVGDGKFVAITGPNGDGKSITIKLVMGTERPAGGRILSDGQGITDMSTTDRTNLGVSFASQQSARSKGVRVVDLLRLATKKKLMMSEVCQYLVEMGPCAKDYINHEVSASLSGGELKRIKIATVIARASKLSVFGEPETDIDPWNFQSLIQVFKHMRQNTNGSILIIFHQERILDIADEIMVIADGKVVNQGTGSEIMPQIMGATSAVDACSKFYRTAQ